jgi:phage terminase large subunit-like protein
MPFNKGKALEVIEFIELLHLTDDFYGQPFVLRPWQKKIIRQIYGTVNRDGCRQYRRGYLEIPKKNGKTTLIAALGLYHLVCDPPGGQIFCCAAEKEQAGISYRAAKSMIEQEPSLAAMLKVVDSKKEIYNRWTGTFLKVLSAEAYSKHGLNPSIIVFDELHAQPNRELWDTMTFAASSTRKQPLHLTITTAGDDPDRKSIGWEQHELALKIIENPKLDPTLFAEVYGAPEDADIYDEAVWKACNPSLGVTIQMDTVRSEALAAKNSESAERLFRWLRLNQWIALKRTGWLPITLWDATERAWEPEELLGQRCYVGLDLSSTTDLTAAPCIFPPSDKHDDWRTLNNAWVPEANMRERETKDHVPYEKWVREGHLTATPGDVVDYGKVAAELAAINQRYDVVHFFCDPWRLEYLKQLLPEEIQAKFIEIPQTMAGMSCGMSEIERMLRSGELTHVRDPLARWSFGNVRVASDGNGNMKPMKNKSIERIDPTVGLINAMAGAIKMEPKRSVYESRGLRTVG